MLFGFPRADFPDVAAIMAGRDGKQHELWPGCPAPEAWQKYVGPRSTPSASSGEPPKFVRNTRESEHVRPVHELSGPLGVKGSRGQGGLGFRGSGPCRGTGGTDERLEHVDYGDRQATLARFALRRGAHLEHSVGRCAAARRPTHVRAGIPNRYSGPRRARTDDPRIKSPMLYQLS